MQFREIITRVSNGFEPGSCSEFVTSTVAYFSVIGGGSGEGGRESPAPPTFLGGPWGPNLRVYFCNNSSA